MKAKLLFFVSMGMYVIPAEKELLKDQSKEDVTKRLIW